MKKLVVISIFMACCNSFSYGQSVKSRTFLQGAYQGNSMMNTSLTALIPNYQSYDTIPWNYQGYENLN